MIGKRCVREEIVNVDGIKRKDEGEKKKHAADEASVGLLLL